MQVQEKFSYSAQPHAAPLKQKTKYRDENPAAEDPQNSQNIMYDARVVRGNTYSAKVLSGSMKKELENATTTKRFPRKQMNRLGSTRRSATPPPVDGRSHMVMQTEDFFEELTDRPIEQDAETQTQPFLDRPASPLFVRAKIGYDVSTQIENGDLFDFNTEVEPILEVLVGKTLHVAMLEIMQEEELEAIRAQQEEFETIRNVELAEVQRLEAEIKRKALEKERRLTQEKQRLEDRRRLEETIAARQFTNQFLGDLHVDVFDNLEEEGHFYDPVKREIEENFMDLVRQGTLQGAIDYDVAATIMLEIFEEARLQARAFESECIRLRKEYKLQLAMERKQREAEDAERRKQEAEEETRRLAAEGGGEIEPAE
jgi:radial spoke head protein 3